MNVEELRGLARAAEPLSPASLALDGHERVVAYNDLVSRFRERVVSARNAIVRGLAVDPDLEHELRLLAKALPGVRHRAEAAVERERQRSFG